MDVPSPFVATAALLGLVAFGLSACSDETEEADETAHPEADAGTDTDLESPSVDSIDFDGSEPADRQRIHVEPSTQRGVISEQPPLAADEYLSEAQAEQVVAGTDLEAIPVMGQDASETHNSIRYAPVGAEQDIFGVGLQIWDLADSELQPDERLAELRDQFVGVDNEVAGALSPAFSAKRSGIRSVVFTAEEHPYVFVLSCDVDHCHDIDDLVELSTEIAAAH